MPGPPDIFTWEKSFRTFGCAMLLAEAYVDHIKDLHGRFGVDSWGVIYRADTRLRSEYLDRIRRELADQPDYGFTPASPWSAVFAAAVRGQEFWAREVHTPATFLLTGNRSLPKDDESFVS